MVDHTGAADDVRGAHRSHCFQGEYRHTCAYGDDACPAAPGDQHDRPDDRTLDHEDRAIALVRYLAASTTGDELEQAQAWARMLVKDMEN